MVGSSTHRRRVGVDGGDGDREVHGDSSEWRWTHRAWRSPAATVAPEMEKKTVEEYTAKRMISKL